MIDAPRQQDIAWRKYDKYRWPNIASVYQDI